MDMFSNPNIGSCVVEQVPCSFAKSRNGKAGTHYAMVLLSPEGSVLHVSSECERKHGPGIQAFHELGHKGTCYTVTEAFSHMLQQVNAEGLLGARPPAPPPEVPPILRKVLESAWISARALHNGRVMLKDSKKPVSMKVAALQNAVDRVSYSLLNLQPVIDTGGMSDRVEPVYQKKQAVYHPVFHVKAVEFLDFHLKPFESETGITIAAPGVYTTLAFDAESLYSAIAVRDQLSTGESAPGSWAFSQRVATRWASCNYTTFADKELRQLELPVKGWCVFCGEQYDRMPRHISGAKHLDRVLEVANLVCKATTTTGLKMLNNPRHRSVFIRER